MAEPLVGVLGGMGPAATVEFYRQLVQQTPASRDQEHLRLVLWADPSVPDRTGALRGTGPSVIPALERGVKQLLSCGVEFIVCPCNTAHVWLPEVAERLGARLVNIVEETASQCRAKLDQGAVAILATPATLESGLYQEATRVHGIEALIPDGDAQDCITEAIYLVKSGSPAQLDRAATLLRSVSQELKKAGAAASLSGCTEVSVIAGSHGLGVPVIDSLASLVTATIREASSHAPATES